jgi:hypothetical protein
MAVAPHHSNPMPFGIIQVSILQNLVHLGLGLAGLVSAQTMQRAHRYLLHGRGGAYVVSPCTHRGAKRE